MRSFLFIYLFGHVIKLYDLIKLVETLIVIKSYNFIVSQTLNLLFHML